MQVNDELRGKAVVLQLTGKVTGGPDVDLFNGKLYRYLDAGRDRVVIDLERVERMSSVGLGMLISAMTSLEKRGGQMIVANIPKSIESLLILTRLITILNAKDSIDEALAAVAA
jgi:anti-anti-sigma factor